MLLRRRALTRLAISYQNLDGVISGSEISQQPSRLPLLATHALAYTYTWPEIVQVSTCNAMQRDGAFGWKEEFYIAEGPPETVTTQKFPEGPRLGIYLPGRGSLQVRARAGSQSQRYRC